MNDILLWGATGQAIVLHEFLNRIGYRIIALFDNNTAVQSIAKDIPIYYGPSGFEKWIRDHANQDVFGLAAIGGSRGKDRVVIQNMLDTNGVTIATAIHPNSYVCADAIIGRGSQVLVNAVICARVHIGEAVIVNTSASIDHECTIGMGVHVGPGAKIAGCVSIDDFSFIGTGAVILPRIKIGKNSIVGAGSIVNKNVPDNVIVYGNPAKIIRGNI